MWTVISAREGEAGVSQAASWDGPRTPHRLRALLTLIVALSVVAALGALAYALRTDITNPSTASCLSVIAGGPLLVLGRFLIRRQRRRRTREIRDARRGGISIGIARPRRERIQVTDLLRATESGRHSGRRRVDPRGSGTPSDESHDAMILEV